MDDCCSIIFRASKKGRFLVYFILMSSFSLCRVGQPCEKVGCGPLQLTHSAAFSKLHSSLQCFFSPQFEKPPWCSGYATHLVNQGSQVLQSVGWKNKPRSLLHMTLAVGETLNPNQPTNLTTVCTYFFPVSWYIYFHDGRKTGNCNIVEDLIRIPLRSQIYMLLLFSLAIVKT